jgi:hypothetical protein
LACRLTEFGSGRSGGPQSRQLRTHRKDPLFGFAFGRSGGTLVEPGLRLAGPAAENNERLLIDALVDDAF